MFQDPSNDVPPPYPPPPQAPQFSNSSFHQEPSTGVHVPPSAPAYPQFNDNHMSQVQPAAYPTHEAPYPTQPHPAYPTQPQPTAYPTQAQVQSLYPTQELPYPSQPQPAYPTQPQPAVYPTQAQVQPLYPTQPPATIIHPFPPNDNPQCVEPQKEDATEQQNRNFANVNRSAKDPYNFLALSIVNLIITAIIPCCWPLLFLTVPALLLSITSKEESNKGKWEDAKASGYWALGLNIAAIVFMVVGFIAVTVRLATL